MRILVCMKQVPDTGEVKLSTDFSLERDFVAQVMNPADESALELALELRDLHGGEVVALTMGPERAESMLREAIARGADRAVLMTDRAFAGADTLITAECLCAAVRALGRFDLILCGRRAADGETGQVGPMLAAMMDMPCAANTTEVCLNGETLCATQLTEKGEIFWSMRLPALVTLCEWSYPLRLPTIAGLRKARDAQVERLTARSLDIGRCGLKASPTRVVRIDARPSGVRPCQKLSLPEVLALLESRGVLE